MISAGICFLVPFFNFYLARRNYYWCQENKANHDISEDTDLITAHLAETTFHSNLILYYIEVYYSAILQRQIVFENYTLTKHYRM